MNFLDKIKAAADSAVASGADQTKATKGGTEIPVAPPGKCKLRFISYIELGMQAGSFQGKPTVKDKVLLGFEVSGPKYPPTILDDGTKIPYRVSIEENYSLNEKAHFKKLFDRMNYSGKAQHMAQLLGDAFSGELFHRKYAKKGEAKDDPSKWTGVAVELRAKGGDYQVLPPRFQPMDEEGNPVGEMQMMKIDPPISEIRGFIWDHPDMEQWSSIFIEGEYPERKDDKGVVVAPAKSKNMFQAKIMQAKNFKGSPIEALLMAGGKPLDIPNVGDDPDEEEAEAPVVVKPVTEAQKNDALAGIA